jgi:hypothetical protein
MVREAYTRICSNPAAAGGSNVIVGMATLASGCD